MSYCNDVKCVMFKKDWNYIKNEIDKMETEDKYVFDFCKIKERKEIVIISWENTKCWNEFNNEAIEKFIDFIHSEEIMGCKYIRIGEGAYTDTDIEVYEEYHENFEIMEKINIIDFNIRIEEY